MTEKISRLVDSELDPVQQRSLIDELVDDTKAQSRWQRYHLIGCVIRDEVITPGRDLSPQIMDKLKNEPTVLAPRNTGAINQPSSDVWKSAAMFAIAASLVLVAVVRDRLPRTRRV